MNMFSRYPAGNYQGLRSQAKGFTLIELMITITVAGILLTIAVPSFTKLVLSNRLKSYANDFVASVHLARSEAIKRNAPIELCMSSNGTSCITTGDWEQGWIVINTADSTVVQRQQAFSNGIKMVESGGMDTMVFQPSGISIINATLKVCQATPAAGHQERIITISATGQSSVTTTTTGSCP